MSEAGSYTTEERVRVLTNMTDSDEPTSENVQQLIRKAQARVDARLRVKYKVPLIEPIPEVIKSIVEDMAGAFLLQKQYSNRPEVLFRRRGCDCCGEELFLDQRLIQRAERDLELVIEQGLLNGLPGIEVAPLPT